MRDIRRPYRNSRSEEKNPARHKDNSSRFSEREEIISRDEEVSRRKKEFGDVEYTREGRPMIKASSHFDVKPANYRRERSGEEFDVLKRSEFFNNTSQRNFDEDKLKEFKQKRNKKKTERKAFGIIFLILIVGGLAAWTFLFNSVKLYVNPKYEDIELTGSFLVFKDDIVVNYASSTLTKTVLKSEPKEVNQKAAGELTIYNNYSEAPQVLITNTRFQTPDGKIFRIGESVTVPGKKGTTPGSVKVKVSADAYGAEYNISATEFTIPGFKGTARFDGFYAKSTEPMTGGVSGIVQIVSPDDIAKAKLELSSSIKSNIIAEAEKIKRENYVTLVKAPLITYTDNQEDLMTTEKTSYELTGSGIILSIREEVLAKMLAQHALGDSYNELESVRLDNEEYLIFSLDEKTDLAADIIKIDITGRARIVWTYDVENIKASLVGQRLTTLNEVLANYSSAITDSSYTASPSWIKKFPTSIERIRLIEEIR